MTEWLSISNMVVALLGTALGCIVWFARWFDARQRDRADAIKSEIRVEARDHVERMNHAEGSIKRLADEVDGLKPRLSKLELGMETVARTRDVGELKIAVTELRADMRSTAGKVDTMYRAAIAASTDAT